VLRALSRAFDSMWTMGVYTVLHRILRVDSMLLHQDDVSAPVVEAWRQQGRDVGVWTVNHAQRKLYFAQQLGCVVMSDDPRLHTTSPDEK
jgi:glycerophosphoryl diester phosphodiesterase